MPDNRRNTVEGFMFLDTDKTNVLGRIRVVLDKYASTIWYRGDEGQIMTHRLDSEEMHEFTFEGTLRINSGNSDIWDANRVWDMLDKQPERRDPYETGGDDISSKTFLIGAYMDEATETGHNGPIWDKLLNQYNRGMLAIRDLAVQVAAMH